MPLVPASKACHRRWVIASDEATPKSMWRNDTGVYRASASDQPQGPFSTVCGAARRDGHFMET